MNPNLCRVALRPRSPFEVFDLTLRFVRERIRPIAWLTLFTVGPAWVVSLGIAWLTPQAWIPLIFAVVVGPLIHAPFTILGGRMLFEPDGSAVHAIRDTLKVWAGLLLTLLAELFTWVLSCTGLGILLLPGLVYLPETALLERVDLGRGLQRSVRLASGQVGQAIMGAAARWGLLLWGGIVGELGGQFLVGFVLQLGQPFGSLFDGVATPYVLLGILASHPLFALYRLFLYVDVRTRMEGWDLQVGLRALGLQENGEDAA